MSQEKLHTVEIPGSMLEHLLQEIEQADYCYLCGNHPSGHHAKGCPIIGVIEARAAKGKKAPA